MNTFSSRKNSRRGHTSPPAGHLPPKAGHTRKRPEGRAADRPSDTPLSGAFFSAVFAMPFVLLIGLLFLLIGTLVGYRSADPHGLIPYLSLAALGLTSLLGGLIAARRRRGHPLLSGLLCGLLINLLMLAASLFFGDAEKATLSLSYPSLAKWGLHAAVALLALLGARLGMGNRR